MSLRAWLFFFPLQNAEQETISNRELALGPRVFLPSSLLKSETFSTSAFTNSIAFEDIFTLKGPIGFSKDGTGLQYFKINIHSRVYSSVYEIWHF